MAWSHHICARGLGEDVLNELRRLEPLSLFLSANNTGEHLGTLWQESKHDV